jgi:hypothetical protein
MYIRVTASDIRNGKPWIPSMDPISLALRREFGVTYATACYSYLRIEDDWITVAFDVPKEVREWMKDYDSGKRMQTIGFDLNAPTQGGVKNGPSASLHSRNIPPNGRAPRNKARLEISIRQEGG